MKQKYESLEPKSDNRFTGVCPCLTLQEKAVRLCERSVHDEIVVIPSKVTRKGHIIIDL